MFEAMVTTWPLVCGSIQLAALGPKTMVAVPPLPAVPIVLLLPWRLTTAAVVPAVLPTWRLRPGASVRLFLMTTPAELLVARSMGLSSTTVSRVPPDVVAIRAPSRWP